MGSFYSEQLLLFLLKDRWELGFELSQLQRPTSGNKRML